MHSAVVNGNPRIFKKEYISFIRGLVSMKQKKKDHQHCQKDIHVYIISSFSKTLYIVSLCFEFIINWIQ